LKFAYLRGLSSSNGDNRRDVIATVFKGVDNRMKSGYLLRDIVNKVSGIRFRLLSCCMAVTMECADQTAREQTA
jgi:hypothetical protein